MKRTNQEGLTFKVGPNDIQRARRIGAFARNQYREIQLLLVALYHKILIQVPVNSSLTIDEKMIYRSPEIINQGPFEVNRLFHHFGGTVNNLYLVDYQEETISTMVKNNATILFNLFDTIYYPEESIRKTVKKTGIIPLFKSDDQFVVITDLLEAEYLLLNEFYSDDGEVYFILYPGAERNRKLLKGYNGPSQYLNEHGNRRIFQGNIKNWYPTSGQFAQIFPRF